MISAFRPLPFFLIASAALICALPWGPSPEFRLVLPLLPYVVIHRCVERWGPGTPDWLVFLAGFATDVAGQGPLGYWALIYLCGYTMIRSVTADRTHGLLSSLFLFLVTIVTLAMMQWSVASIYYLRSMEIQPLILAVVISAGGYIVMLLLISGEPTVPVRINNRLERGL
jgi:rod shape-determining protein MreD